MINLSEIWVILSFAINPSSLKSGDFSRLGQV